MGKLCKSMKAKKQPEPQAAPKPVCWVVSEGIAGTENQCLGVAAALGLEPVVKRVKLKFPWSLVSPYVRFGHGYAFTRDSSPLEAPWPDIVIASGRKSIAASLYIKEASGGQTFTVQLQDPKIPANFFDMVAVPFHDKLRGDNVLVTDAALHRVTPEILETAKEKFSPALSQLPSPRVAVLIGGTSRTHKMNPGVMTRIVSQIKTLSQKGASLMVTVSRRTDEHCIGLLKYALARLPNTHFWNGMGENPYFGYLAWADYILVTEDSVSMTSEAVSTGKPVYTLALDGGSERFTSFHRHMQELGFSRPFMGTLENWTYTPPSDTVKVADEIRKRKSFS